MTRKSQIKVRFWLRPRSQLKKIKMADAIPGSPDPEEFSDWVLVDRSQIKKSEMADAIPGSPKPEVFADWMLLFRLGPPLLRRPRHRGRGRGTRRHRRRS
jgi:hypothetical protein